jgi:hypothetical protein
MKSNTPDLLKFKRLQRRLGVPVAHVCGLLELLWISTAKNAPQGDIGRFTNEEIAIGCYWDGAPDEFVKALVDCGWLDNDPEYRLVVHDWHDHAPRWVHGNLRRYKRNFVSGTSQPTEQPTREATEQPTREPARDAPPSQAKPSQVKPSQVKPTIAGSCVVETTPQQAAATRVEEVTEFGFVVCNGSEWFLSKSKFEEYRQTFPELDLPSEFRKAAQWTRDNPKRRKTAKGMPAFLGNWLSREQNRPKPGQPATAAKGNAQQFWAGVFKK